MKKKKRSADASRTLFAVLSLITTVLVVLTVAKAQGYLIPKQPQVVINGNTIILDSLTVEQKIAQMLIVEGNLEFLPAWKNLQIGGVHLFARKSEQLFYRTIGDYKEIPGIPMFFTVDLEGCLNPFGSFRNFTPASEIDSLGAAFEKGFREGEYLEELGINLNFAPVVDLDDQIWKCRSFAGDENSIAEFAEAYVLGLQSNGVIATAKHYPGKTLVSKDPHKFVVGAEISEQDVYPYRYLFGKGNAKAVMVSHIIVEGEINSEGIPSVASPEIIADIKDDFEGLVISDEIHMLGLKNYYENIDEVYIAVFKAGNDIILNFDNHPDEIHRMIQVVAQAVRDGRLSENEIDKSVTKILEAKGLEVV